MINSAIAMCIKGRGASPTGIGASLFMSACILILVLTGCYIVPSVCFMCGVSMAWWMFPTVMLISFFSVFFITSPHRAKIKAIISSLLVIIVAIGICILIEDISYDGNAYHQEAVALMVKGWNPYWEPSGNLFGIWIDHYGIAVETAQATVVSAVGRIEAGKAINWILIVGASLLAGSTIFALMPTIKRSSIFLLICVICANPVGILQSCTFLIDFTKYYYILILICSAILMSKPSDVLERPSQVRNISMLIAILTTVMAIGTKFNIFFEIGLTLILILMWCLIKGYRALSLRIFIVGLCGTVIGAFALGWHPYISNYLNAGHPLFPLMGEGSVDIMTGTTPDIFKEHNRFFNFFYSMLIPAKSTSAAGINGFGILMFPIFVLSIIAWLVNSRRWPGVISYSILCILGSCFIFAQTWWARYISQLWLVPVVVMSAIEIYGSKHQRVSLRAGFLLIGFSTLWCFTWQPWLTFKYNVMRRHLYTVGKEMGTLRMVNTLEAGRMHFEERGIRILPVAPEQVDPQGTFCYFYLPTSVNTFPMVETGREDTESYIKEMERYHLKYRDWVMSNCDWEIWTEG